MWSLWCMHAWYWTVLNDQVSKKVLSEKELSLYTECHLKEPGLTWLGNIKLMLCLTSQPSRLPMQETPKHICITDIYITSDLQHNNIKVIWHERTFP